MDIYPERMAVQTPTLMVLGYIRQAVRCFECECFEDFHRRPPLGNAEEFVGLQTQSPSRMLQAVLNGQLSVSLAIGTVHRLQEKMLEGKALKLFRIDSRLREDEFQFIASPEEQLRSCLGTHTDPIEPRWRQPCTVRLDGDFEGEFVEHIDKFLVQLEERFAAGADNQRARVARRSYRPRLGDCGRKFPT